MKKSQQSTLFQYYGNQKQHEQDNQSQNQLKSKKDKPESVHNGKVIKKEEKERSKGEDLNNIIEIDDLDDDDDTNLLEGIESIDNYQKGKEPKNFVTTQQNVNSSSFKCKDVFLDNHNCDKSLPEIIPGFDVNFGSNYIYPTNFPVRDYQFNIIRRALLRNTLVVLPTGLGKTFIAAVVMYNFYRWYPQKKLIFMAPTKPLVAQQIGACHNIMGISYNDTVEMTGAIAAKKRSGLWSNKRVFFMTPQVLQNDLANEICSSTDIVCLVFDEAHKALGNHAYSQVIKLVSSTHSNFRVLALSATPGSDMKAVQEVVSNLLIAHVELRSEESIDIQKYIHGRKVEKIVVPLCTEIKQARAVFLEILQSIVIRLHGRRALWQNDASKVSKFILIKAREQWRANNANTDKTTIGHIEGDFALLMSLYHALDLLMQHGLLSFYNFLKAILAGLKGTSRSKMEILKSPKFMDLMEGLHTKIESDDDNQSLNGTIIAEKAMTPKQRLLKSIPKPKRDFSSHPKLKKLEEIVIEHFRKFQTTKELLSSQTPLNTRIMIFSQFRDSVQEITAVLTRHEPLVKVMSFIGQGSKEGINKKSQKGLSQKEQIEILRKFRTGGFNTVVSTSVGEEGLDIGDVDLIICFDASSSPIRLVQRMGRTGRKRDGRIVILVGEGKEEAIYQRSLTNKKGIHKNLLNATKSLELYEDSPRMIPRHLNPKCYKMNIVIDQCNDEENMKSKKATTKSAVTTSKPTNRGIKKFMERGLLNEMETNYLENNFQDDKSFCEKCRKLQNTQSSRKVYCHHINNLKSPLSLNSWTLWQTNTQSQPSTTTRMFCNIMETCDRFRSQSELDRYQKSLSSKFIESDVVDYMQNKPQNQATKKITGKTFRGNLNNNFSSDDDFWDNHEKPSKATNEIEKLKISPNKTKTLDSIDNYNKLPKMSLKEDKNNRMEISPIFKAFRGEKKKGVSPGIFNSTGKIDQIMKSPLGEYRTPLPQKFKTGGKFKPCSLEEMLEKEEERLSEQRKKKRIRLTKLPKPPTFSLDNMSDIEGCMTSEENVELTSSQAAVDTLYNRVKKKKRKKEQKLNGNPKEPLSKKLKHSENFIDSNDCKFSVSFEENDVTQSKQNNLAKNKEDSHTQILSVMFPMSSPSRQETIPSSKPNKSIDTPAQDVVPEAPSDIELSSFLFESMGEPCNQILDKNSNDQPDQMNEHQPEESNSKQLTLKTKNNEQRFVDTDNENNDQNTKTQKNILNLPERKGPSIFLNEFNDVFADGILDVDLDDVLSSSPPIVSKSILQKDDISSQEDRLVENSNNSKQFPCNRERAPIKSTGLSHKSDYAFENSTHEVLNKNAKIQSINQNELSSDSNEQQQHADNVDEGSPLVLRRKRGFIGKRNQIIDSPPSPSRHELTEVVHVAEEDIDHDDMFEKPDDSFEVKGNFKKKNPCVIGKEKAKTKKRVHLMKIHRQAKMFLDEQCEDDEEDTAFDDSRMLGNNYVMDSFIDDASQPSPVSIHRSGKGKEYPVVDMNAIYRQSLMTPRQNDLKFHTPAFKRNRNKYKLANLAEKYNNISHNESSEAEEIAGFIDSEDEEKLNFDNQWKLKRSINNNRKKSDVDVCSQQDEQPGPSRKPGKRVRRMLESDEEDFIVDSASKNPKKQTIRHWRNSLTLDQLPTTKFSFGINWNF